MEPILITGCARSGTSMTAGVTDICGAWGGNMSGPNSNNKKGMFENPDVRQNVVKPLLRGMGVDPMGQYPLPSDEQLKAMAEPQAMALKGRVLGIMESQGLGEDRAWFYKGAKMCLVWPLWHMAFPNAKWVIVRRDEDEIINSCNLTGFMRNPGPKGWKGWVEAHVKRFEEMKDAGLQVMEVWPSKMIEGDYSEIKKVMRWLDLFWDEYNVTEFISPSLWNSKGRT